MKARILLDWIAAAVSLAAVFVVLAILFQARALPVTYVVPGAGNAGPLILAHQKLAANSWIDREVNKQGERCCDAGKDCHIVPAERVMSHRDGVMLPDYGNVEIPGNQIQVSQDGQYWVCIWGGKVRCFHAPHSGS